jgi:hypothetical protein
MTGAALLPSRTLRREPCQSRIAELFRPAPTKEWSALGFPKFYYFSDVVTSLLSIPERVKLLRCVEYPASFGR